MRQEWFVVRDEAEIGPLSAAQLKQMGSAGMLRPSDLVRRGDMKTPVPAGQIKGLFPDILTTIEKTANSVGNAAKHVHRVSKSVGRAAEAITDAVGGVADATDKIRQAATSVATITTGLSTASGSVGDLLRPLGNINLGVFVLAGAATPVLVIVAKKQKSKSLVYRYGVAAIATLTVSLVFGMWTGVAGVIGTDNRGALASNIPSLERLQETILPGTRVSIPVDPAPAPVTAPAPSPLVHTFKGHTSYVTHLAISPNGKLFASGSNDQTVRLWDLTTRRELWKKSPFSTNVFGLTFSPDGKQVIAAGSNRVKHLNISSGEVLAEFAFEGAPGLNIPGISFDRGSSRLAVASNAIIRVYGIAQGNSIARRDSFWTPCLAFGNSQDEIFCGGNEGDGKITLWSVRDQALKKTFTGLRDRTVSICVSQDNRLLAASTGPSLPKDRPAQNRIAVWEVSSGRKLHEFNNSAGWQYGLSFSPNGRLLAAGGRGVDDDWWGHRASPDNVVHVWDLETGKELHRFQGHQCAIVSTTFTPDGKFLLSSSSDSTIKLWRID